MKFSIITATYNSEKYILEPDQGIYDALNKGIQRATRDIIGFVLSYDTNSSF